MQTSIIQSRPASQGLFGASCPASQGLSEQGLPRDTVHVRLPPCTPPWSLLLEAVRTQYETPATLPCASLDAAPLRPHVSRQRIRQVAQGNQTPVWAAHDDAWVYRAASRAGAPPLALHACTRCTQLRQCYYHTTEGDHTLNEGETLVTSVKEDGGASGVMERGWEHAMAEM